MKLTCSLIEGCEYANLKTPSRRRCWRWTGDCNSNSTPVFNLNGERINVKKVFYIAFFNNPLKHRYVVSWCKTPRCVNPHHCDVFRYRRRYPLNQTHTFLMSGGKMS